MRFHDERSLVDTRLLPERRRRECSSSSSAVSTPTPTQNYSLSPSSPSKGARGKFLESWLPAVLLGCSHYCLRHHVKFILVLDESKDMEAKTVLMNERSESDKIVDAMDFGELCNDFECISSPSVEATARQLARDILELREGNRSLEYYSISVKYKDPIRTFMGREKYVRPLWATEALEDPSVTVQEMQMLSTSELSIKWLLKGRPKNPLFAALGGDLVLYINSRFTLNQISGQVIEHDEFWDLSASSAVSRSYFWISRRLFSTIEAGKDTIDAVKSMSTGISSDKENKEIFPDLSGDPTKFFQSEDGLQRDAYQIALVLAVFYFVVQFLRATL